MWVPGCVLTRNPLTYVVSGERPGTTTRETTMTKRQIAKVAKAERLVREAIALLNEVDTELRAASTFSVTATNDRHQVVTMASALERAL